jgi:hypothetical protein
MSKYDPLSKWLAKQRGNRLLATFKQIENVLGFDLPASARIHRPWWANDLTHVHAKAWLLAGFQTEDVNLSKETLAFVR